MAIAGGGIEWLGQMTIDSGAWIFDPPSMPTRFPELDKLPADEKMILAAELWSEATADEGPIVPDPKIVAALEERLEHYRRDPSSAFSWDEVKRRIRQYE